MMESMGESLWLDVEAKERVELDLLRPGNSRLPSVGVACKSIGNKRPRTGQHVLEESVSPTQSST